MVDALLNSTYCPQPIPEDARLMPSLISIRLTFSDDDDPLIISERRLCICSRDSCSLKLLLFFIDMTNPDRGSFRGRNSCRLRMLGILIDRTNKENSSTDMFPFPVISARYICDDLRVDSIFHLVKSRRLWKLLTLKIRTFQRSQLFV